MAYQELYSLSHDRDNDIVLYLQLAPIQRNLKRRWSGSAQIRQHYHMTGWKLDERIIPYILHARLYSVARLNTIAINHARWLCWQSFGDKKCALSTFFVGKATFTLQDSQFFADHELTVDLSSVP